VFARISDRFPPCGVDAAAANTVNTARMPFTSPDRTLPRASGRSVARAVASGLLRTVLVLLLTLVTSSLCVTHTAFTDYEEALQTNKFAESQTRPEYCCRTPLDLRSMFPQLSHDVTATILSMFSLSGPDHPGPYALGLTTVDFMAKMQRCQCTNYGADISLEARLGFWKVPFLYTNNYTDATHMERDCIKTFHEPVVLIPRIPPPEHFGHQLLTIVPPLAAVKLYLQQHGLDITRLQVVFIDITGVCVSVCVFTCGGIEVQV
jgi:hypothetical protein